jgi:LacI family transcriptional regulator
MARSKKPYPTITDVARAVDLSPTTVSFVINNVPYANIPEETRERVWQAVKALGYRPNAAAKVLRTQRTHTIGFVTDEVATTPFAGQIIKGAQELAWDNGKMLIIINAGGNPSVLDAAVEVLLDRQVEGIIYAAVYHQEVQPPPNLSEVPAVLLDCYCADRSLPSVVPDEVGGGRLATDLLIAQGHRRIGFINLNPGIPAAVGRLQGYREALTAAGIAFDPELVRHGNAQADGGYQQIQQLMRLDAPPTAVFCGTDRTAMGAYDGLRDLGLRVPQDVSIVGFDNQEIIAAYLRPALTTVQLPHYEMGRWAVQYLLDLIKQPSATTPPQRLESCSPIIRESVRPPAG